MPDFEITFQNHSAQAQPLTMFQQNAASQGGTLFTFNNPAFSYIATYPVGAIFRIKADGANQTFSTILT